MARFHRMRLLDVVEAVNDMATSEDETLATVASLINSGKVRFCGALAGATIDLSARAGAAPSIHHRGPRPATPQTYVA